STWTFVRARSSAVLQGLLDTLDERTIEVTSHTIVHPNLTIVLNSESQIIGFLSGVAYTADELRSAMTMTIAPAAARWIPILYGIGLVGFLASVIVWAGLASRLASLPVKQLERQARL